MEALRGKLEGGDLSLPQWALLGGAVLGNLALDGAGEGLKAFGRSAKEAYADISSRMVGNTTQIELVFIPIDVTPHEPIPVPVRNVGMPGQLVEMPPLQPEVEALAA